MPFAASTALSSPPLAPLRLVARRGRARPDASGARAHRATALVISGSAESPITVQSVSIRTEISGSLALTSVELTFFNPNRRLLEGELQFPLLDGQSVIGMAMDIDGKLRDAVPVDKARGQAVFEDVTRAHIDPGAARATQGNNYKLRVYPDPAQRAHGGRAALRGTLAERARPRRLPAAARLRATRVARSRSTLRVTRRRRRAGSRRRARRAGLRPRRRRLYVVRATRSDFARPRRARARRSCRRPAPQVYTQVVRRPHLFPRRSPGRRRNGPARAAASRSRSSGTARARGARARSRARIRAARRLLPKAAQRRSAAHAHARRRGAGADLSHVASGDWRALRRALEATVYDGATDLGAFAPDAAAQRSPAVHRRPRQLRRAAACPRSRVPVYAISAAARADAARLRHIAEASGGRFIDLFADSAGRSRAAFCSNATRIVSRSTATAPRNSSPPRRFRGSGRLAIAGVLAARARPRCA